MLTKEQLVDRLNYVTGSDCAAICGLSPYKTAMQLWLEKTKRIEQDDISHLNHIKFGNFMENGVADWFAAESGKTLQLSTNEMIIHPTLSWMSGNVDRLIDGENAILECKTSMQTEGWGEQGTDQIPTSYLLQVAHYCAVGGFDRAYIAVVFTMTREFKWYKYERNLSLEAKLIKAESDFWFNNVQADVAPEPKTETDVSLMFKKPNFDPYYGTAEDEALAIKYKALKAMISDYGDELEKVRDDICARMKDHETMIGPDGKQLATWKFVKAATRFDAKTFEKERPELYNHYLKTSEKASRRLVIKGDKE